jgi:type I restriction enzyme M protein
MNDYSSEDDVKYKFAVSFLEKKGYSTDFMDFNKSIKVQEGRKEKTIFADIVVYIDKKKQSPIILVETKSPNEILNKAAVEQAISYARLLPRIAPFALLTNSSQTRIYQVVDKNRIEELPTKADSRKDIVTSVISKATQDSLRQDAIHELFVIDDVKTFRNVLKQCHNEIRNNEGYDPIQAFDEMSKILFCKMYEEKYDNDNRFTLRVFDRTINTYRFNIIQKIYEETIKHPKYASLFPENDKIKLKDRTIRRIVKLFEHYDLSLTAFDIKGEAFEYFLSDTFTGGLGEYFTPRNVVEFIVDAIDPKIAEKIVDPFCGTGGFLIYAFDVVHQKIRLQDFSEDERQKWQEALSSRSLFGTDWKERTIQACKMNMIVHGDGHTGIFLHDGLTNIKETVQENSFDVCLTNPPFGAVENNKEVLDNYHFGKGRESQEREILALERAIQLIKPERKCGMVVIEGILNNDKYKPVRDYVKQKVWIDGIVSLPSDTFSGYGSKAATSLFFFTKKTEPDEGEQKSIFMAICNNSGYSASGLEIPGNQLPDILVQYKKFLKNPADATISGSNVAVVSTDDLRDRFDPQHYISQVESKISTSAEVIKTQEQLKQHFKNVQADSDSLVDSQLTKIADIGEWDIVKITKLVDEYKAPEKLEPNTDYALVGVRGHALGAFIKDTKKGSEIKAKKLYKTKPGCLIYNRLFAHRGSFAILDDSFENCYVSGEFPQFIAKEQTKYEPANLIKYLFYYCINPVFVDNVRRYSSGSTKGSRFRLKEDSFLDFKIKIPASSQNLNALVNKLDDLFSTTKKIKETQMMLDSEMEQLKERIVMTLPQS